MPLRKVSRCHNDLIGILNKVADKLNLRNIDYALEFGCEDIDIFFTGIYKVNIKGIRDGQKVKFVAIIKWHGDAKKRESVRKMYHREYSFYQFIVPELLNIQKYYGIIEGLKIKFCNCVFATIEQDKEAIVFLPDKIFKCQDRFHKTDLSHSVLVIKNLAKFHALSFVLKHKKPVTYDEIKKLYSKDIQYSDPNCVSKSMECYYNASVSTVSDPIAKEKLKALAPSISLVLNKCTTASPYSVICHGDCWNNNIFYKYKRGKPVETIFIDHQLCRLASPVTDLSYYFYMTAEKDFLIKHYDHLLQIYYGTLTAVLRQCNLNVEEIYPRTVFEGDLKRYSVLGLIEALVSMKIITAAVKDAFQMTEMKYFTEDYLFETLSQNDSLYVERVNGIVCDFFERGYSLTDVLKSI